MHSTDLAQADPGDLIACPQCDALYRARMPGHGGRAVCARCHTVLIAPRRRAGMIIIALSAAQLVMVLGAVWFPFLRISRQGFANEATLLDAALSFTGGPLLLLSLAVTALIVLVPLARAVLTIYVLGPLVFDRPAPPGALRLFAFAEALRPWSMAEIFALGCAVALVKVADLAHLSFGPAFWMFAGLVFLTVIHDRWMCRWSVWRALEQGYGARKTQVAA